MIASTIIESEGLEFMSILQMSCRGVPASRLPSILSTGVDVEPTNAHIFANALWKALEYGCDGDQVIQVFYPQALQRSWKEKPASISPEERAEIEQDYPNVITSIDGSRLWFTRFPLEDKRTAGPYERAHGRWIPGDASKALAALVIITDNPRPLLETILVGLEKLQNREDGTPPPNTATPSAGTTSKTSKPAPPNAP
jgi:hypothetical protein